MTQKSPAVERRMRRQKQAMRESEILERQGNGKKAFNLTLENDGIPYGPGKKAWISEINKLAAGLDPSCLHIRKQSYEDMCIVKDRLNHNFEYSGVLNEDHIRALLGKAVTRRRTELISFINNDGEKPKHLQNIDDEIWDRLKKIANSRQRESRTEHGRYANTCRQTVGRTGPVGVEGVRQKLLEHSGKSPDPDEVAEEMTRDKGYSRLPEKEVEYSKSRSGAYSNIHMEHRSLPPRSHNSCC